MTNRAATDAQTVAETTAALQLIVNAVLAQVDSNAREKAARIPRDLLFPLQDDLADATADETLRYTLFRPHYVAGVAVSAGNATTGTCEIDVEISLDGGATWATIFSDLPTIESGKLAGAAIVGVNIEAAVGGITGTIVTTLLAAGTMIRPKLVTRGGALGIVVQLGLETRVDLTRVFLPTMAGMTPLGTP